MSTASAVDSSGQTTGAQTPTQPEDVAALEEGSEHEPKEATSPNFQDDASKVRPIHGWKWFLTCVCIYSTALLVGLDITIVADVQPNIVKSLGQIEKLTWVGVGFPLGSVATILPIGYAYGLFDIKSLYLSSIVLFEAGSALCGGAPTMDALIVGRVIAGVGGAGMYLGVLNYLGIFTTLRERNMMNALIGMVWGLGTILGPIIGGSFAVSSATWRVRLNLASTRLAILTVASGPFTSISSSLL